MRTLTFTPQQEAAIEVTVSRWAKEWHATDEERARYEDVFRRRMLKHGTSKEDRDNYFGSIDVGVPFPRTAWADRAFPIRQ